MLNILKCNKPKLQLFFGGKHSLSYWLKLIMESWVEKKFCASATQAVMTESS